MIPKTIDISTGPEILRDADPIGLHAEVSVRQYLERLRARVAERFPKARVFVRWSPSLGDGTGVYTIPRTPKAEETLKNVANEVASNSDTWLSYDDEVRAAFAA
ncbi:MAG: hypothetical protein AB8I08_31885 [Sandaracinaceae bacterium]